MTGAAATVAARRPSGAAERARSGLDRLLGGRTLYRTVLLVLALLLAVAAIAGAAGLVPFSPVAIAVTAAVAVAATYASTRLFALLRGVRPHGESSVITGLIIACLFFPVLDGPDLVAVAIAGVAAGASKLLLVRHGRHLFNPVAVGAVVVTLTGISGAAWWVATPVLLPVIVLGGALVLARSGTWDVALVVVAIAVPGSAAVLAAGGTPLPLAVWTAVASYPYLFFAAFMVSEPMTQAPRRRQRILVGAVIGVICLLPFSLGPLTTAPEIALLIGNAVAFVFGPRARIRLTVTSRELAHDHVLVLRFQPERPLRFRAGQYAELTLPHRRQDGRGARRTFSAASGPRSPELTIATRLAVPASSFKHRLAALEPGDRVAGSAVGGDLVLPARTDRPLLWFAGGIGITPFAGMADDLVSRRERRDVVLVQVVRGPGDLALSAPIAAAGVRVLVVGPPSVEPLLPEGWTRVADRIASLDLQRHVPDAHARLAYAAGSPSTLRDVRRLARSAGVRRIRTDRFFGA